jgi:uncharacterized protein with FMN-binding domain
LAAPGASRGQPGQLGQPSQPGLGQSGQSNLPGASSQPAPSSPFGAAPAQVAPAGPVTYQDGTYSGYGTSRRGDVEVAVVIQGGKIVSADVTRCMTQYPESRIARLPAQVVARQSAQVDRVSGATYSTQAYQQAVQQALNKARA